MKSLRSIFAPASIAVLLAAACAVAAQDSSDLAGAPAKAIVFFDVAELPVRINEPSLTKSDKDFVLECAVANRSGEQLVGVRLILLAIDPAGKLRNRVTWNERAEIPMYSIKTFTFHPNLTKDLRPTDRLFLGIDEAIGRETIWLAAEAEKALRAYSLGDHEVVPAVRSFANKYDSRPGMLMLPPIRN